MGGLGDGGIRDRQEIERELRLRTIVRSAHLGSGGVDQIDALLDELIELDGTAKHRWGNDNSDARPSLWR
jgi:hypothetical protein